MMITMEVIREAPSSTPKGATVRRQLVVKHRKLFGREAIIP
jgi:hypothetical protein